MCFNVSSGNNGYFSGNIYNKVLIVEFLEFIRKEKKFKNLNHLKKQIKIDLLTAKQTR